MAIVRCQDHPPCTNSHAAAVEPVSFPETALICGRGDSSPDQWGWGYLLSDELEAFRAGSREFGILGPDSSSESAKVHVGENLVDRLGDWSGEVDQESGGSLQSLTDIDRN